ncbi:transmembrane protein 100 [Astyanax mexicanus]|uniref:Transmembrane protein 100-like n=1 Tax=Astyanax mexicanus TaxID=7994 RepID=A0A8T2LYN9_ASTMX|nr:transmembrane protein 100 [Astyanax mexicanus]KAG9276044.1 transmembrane protein 100-like [Astyanax mexicanus]
MEILDPSALPDPATPTVTFDPRSETVTFPSRVVSVAGVTVITGGTEMSWGSCILAFGFWGTLIGLSMVCVGLWDYSVQKGGDHSLLLVLGLVVLAVSSGFVLGVFGFRLLMKKRRRIRRSREEGKVVLVSEEGMNVIKTVTV